MKKIILLAFLSLIIIAGCKKNDIVTEKSGLKYSNDTLGTGKEAKMGDLVSVHFKAWMIKDSSNLFSDWVKDTTKKASLLGSSFESNRPFKFELGSKQFIMGVDEGIKGMKVGGTRTIIIPSRLAYGPMGMGPIPPNTNIKAIIKLIDVTQPAKMWSVDTSKAQVTKSGLKYVIISEGTGPDVDSGKTVTVNYSGYLLNGKKFDSSVDAGKPLVFPVGQGMVMKGWDEGVALLKKGSKARLIIPASLAFGEKGGGPIPPNSTLIFDIEVVDVK